MSEENANPSGGAFFVSSQLILEHGSEDWQKLRYRAEHDFYWFCHTVLNYSKYFLEEETHRLALRFMQRNTGIALIDEAPLQLIMWPRETGKSSCGTIGSAIWLACLHPDIAILIANEKEETAKDFVKQIKWQFESNALLRALFPEVIPPDFNKVEWSATRATLHRSTGRPEATFDCTGVGGSKVGKHYDVIVCLRPDQEIYTSRGLVQAQDLRPGLRALSHDGRFHSIQAVNRRAYSGELVGIRTWHANEPFWVTPEHPILVQRYKDGLPAVAFVPAGEVTENDICVMPRLQSKAGNCRLLGDKQQGQNELLKHLSTWRMLGLWTAEGCRTEQKNRVRLTIGAHEDHLATFAKEYCRDVLGVPCTAKLTPSNSYLVGFSHADFKALTRKIGKRAYDKIVPAFVLQAGHGKVREFLRGYYDGDGCTAQGRQQATSTSKSLLFGVSLLENRLGNLTSIINAKRAGEAAILGNECSVRDAWSLMVGAEPSSEQPAYGWMDPRFVYRRIRSVEREHYSGDVYNCEVADTHTMVSMWMAHHNCDDLITKEGKESVIRGNRLPVQETNRWVNQLEPMLSLSSRKTIGPGYPFIRFIGTHWFSGDTYEHIQEKFSYGERPTKLRISDILTDGRTMSRVIWRAGDLVTFKMSGVEDGRVVFPRIWPQERMDKLRMIDPELFACNIMNNPADAAVRTFQDSWLRYWKFADQSGTQLTYRQDDGSFATIGASSLLKIAVTDPAFSANAGGSRAACVVLGVDSGSGKMFVLDVSAERKDPHDNLEDFLNMIERWQVRRAFVEIAGQQKAYLQWLQTEASRRNIPVVIDEVKPGGRAKDVRIEGLMVPFKDGQIYVHPSQSVLLDDEYRTWRPTAEKADVLDALAYSVEMAPKPRATAGGDAKERSRRQLAAYYRRRGITPTRVA